MTYRIVFLLVLLFVKVSLAAELTEAECHSSREEGFLADCIERQIPNACDSLSGGNRSFLVSRCLRAQREIADRRIQRATEAIGNIVGKLPLEKRASVNEAGEREPPRDHLVAGNIMWKKFVLEECYFLNELDDISAMPGEVAGYCTVRLMNERASTLEALLLQMQSAQSAEK